MQSFTFCSRRITCQHLIHHFDRRHAVPESGCTTDSTALMMICDIVMLYIFSANFDHCQINYALPLLRNQANKSNTIRNVFE